LGLLAAVPNLAFAKLEIRNIQSSYGPLGPVRKSSEYIVGDEVYFRFTTVGARADDDGRLRGEIRLKLFDAKGKLVQKSESPVQQVPALGGESFPAGASWSLDKKFPPGAYELEVEVADLIAGEAASFRRKFTVKPPEFALLRVRFYHDAAARVPARVGGTVGQNLAIKMEAIGFDKSKGEIDVDFEIQVIDAQGKPVTPKPIRVSYHNEKPDEVKAMDSITFSGLLSLNRAGEFAVRMTVTDKRTKKKLEFETPLKVTPP
jgi:hypothetical protein